MKQSLCLVAIRRGAIIANLRWSVETVGPPPVHAVPSKGALGRALLATASNASTCAASSVFWEGTRTFAPLPVSSPASAVRWTQYEMLF